MRLRTLALNSAVLLVAVLSLDYAHAADPPPDFDNRFELHISDAPFNVAFGVPENMSTTPVVIRGNSDPLIPGIFEFGERIDVYSYFVRNGRTLNGTYKTRETFVNSFVLSVIPLDSRALPQAYLTTNIVEYLSTPNGSSNVGDFLFINDIYVATIPENGFVRRPLSVTIPPTFDEAEPPVIVTSFPLDDPSMARSIPVANGEFESPGNEAESFSLGISGWDVATLVEDPVQASDIDFPVGAGTFAPSRDMVESVEWANATVLDGHNLAFVREATATQVLDAVAEPNSLYTLSFTFGDFWDDNLLPAYSVELLAGDDVLIEEGYSRHESVLNTTMLLPRVLEATVPFDHESVGKPLSLRITAPGEVVAIDSLRLIVQPIPEPASWSLGLIGVALAMWKRPRRMRKA